jgi:nucleoside-diphosphate-sugar epimerase
MISSQSIDVVGGSGFIGTRLCDRLKRNPNISFKIIDKAMSSAHPNESNIGDVRNPSDLLQHLTGESILINLAAEHRDDVRPLSLYDEVNVEGAKNICHAARKKNIQTIIFTSTVAVYGFACVETNESGIISPFNDYGRTKYLAENVYREWYAEDEDNRTLVIIRPTVVFGEKNRGNVYNLLKQIASGKFVMIGDGANRKSMAYVENVCAFIEYCIGFKTGVYTYNFIDKPDFTMNGLVVNVRMTLGMHKKSLIRIPFELGYAIGKVCDLLAFLSKKKLTISSVRVKKFCSNSVFNTSISETGFISPVTIKDALRKTVSYEFLESHADSDIFYTE